MAILDEGKEMCRIRKRRRKKWEITAEIRQCVFWYEHVYFCWWRDANGKKKWTRFVFFPPLTLFPPLNVSVHLSVPSCQVRRCWQSTARLSVHLSVSRPRPRHRCLHLTFSLWLLMNEFCYSEKRRFWWTMIILIFRIFPVYKLLLFFFCFLCFCINLNFHTCDRQLFLILS